MGSKTNLRASGWPIAAGLVFFSAAAQGQSGVTITQSEETRVRVGMSTAEIERAMGRPARIINYRNAPGPTWTYHVVGAPFGMTDFDVSFDAEGRVLWASERVLGGAGR
jgi:hypothetical protein